MDTRDQIGQTSPVKSFTSDEAIHDNIRNCLPSNWSTEVSTWLIDLFSALCSVELTTASWPKTDPVCRRERFLWWDTCISRCATSSTGKLKILVRPINLEKTNTLGVRLFTWRCQMCNHRVAIQQKDTIRHCSTFKNVWLRAQLRSLKVRCLRCIGVGVHVVLHGWELNGRLYIPHPSLIQFGE